MTNVITMIKYAIIIKKATDGEYGVYAPDFCRAVLGWERVKMRLLKT